MMTERMHLSHHIIGGVTTLLQHSDEGVLRGARRELAGVRLPGHQTGLQVQD